MSYVLPLQLTPASKAKATVLLCPGTTRLMLTCRSPAKGTAGAEAGIAGSIYYELGAGTGGAPQWEGAPRLVTPGTLGRSVVADAVRVWSADPAAPQFIQIEAD